MSSLKISRTYFRFHNFRCLLGCKYLTTMTCFQYALTFKELVSRSVISIPRFIKHVFHKPQFNILKCLWNTTQLLFYCHTKNKQTYSVADKVSIKLPLSPTILYQRYLQMLSKQFHLFSSFVLLENQRKSYEITVDSSIKISITLLIKHSDIPTYIYK